MALATRCRLGRYEVLALLGSGGMGEVYRARDEKLGREVALKILPAEYAADPARLQRFEQEARAVGALNHPNILTVHDVGVEGGTPYLVTELLEGETLREMLGRGSLSPQKAVELAAEVARGLSAAHAKGILHRDLKPENLFLTSDGRLKILDFGLAKLREAGKEVGELTTEPVVSQPGAPLGTLGYMSPEQLRGQAVDARSDVFALGVVLHELLSGKSPFRRASAADTMSAILNEDPPRLTLTGRGIPPALDGLVRRCLEKRPADRFHSAHDLALALESVLASPAGQAVAEEAERGPYPGLASFMERDAAVFFGREGEVAALWEKLRTRRLLAVIGPSGAGKTSFIRAGAIPARPRGWGAVAFTPGRTPLKSLARALAPELAHDPEALRSLVSCDDADVLLSLVRKWRHHHVDAVLAADQFEELFTLNPPAVQATFTALIGRLATEGDVHVLLSLRDDFLMRCHEQASLAPVFSDLTPLLPLRGEALRRALVEPARKQGFAFEDEALVEEMLGAVEGERGALPLLAFAAARLWEKRDLEGRVLTRSAHAEIGGVVGALAQHAEATLDRIGPERRPIVREIFRNLVTAHGTRAAIDREDLLSAMPEPGVAAEVLGQLIDGRLLVSYDVEGGEGQRSHHRIEIVHESLLASWPRLVRWQAQDEEGALLRDQLKQAAHLWEEKGRTPDLLWAGTAEREFELWRERYAGSLTTVEVAFSDAMVSRARRRARLQRLAIAAVMTSLAAVAVVIGISRQQAARARDQAQAEARRAEANTLLALGRAELDRYPLASLAYARKSLEVADTLEGRRSVIEALWRSPTARLLPVDPPTWGAALSPAGRWLAAFTFSENVLLWENDGRLVQAIGGHRPPGSPPGIAFTPGGEALLTWSPGEPRIRLLSIPDGQEIRWLPANRPKADVNEWWSGAQGWAVLRDGVQVIRGEMGSGRFVTTGVETWPYDGGTPRVLGSWRAVTGTRSQDASGSRIAFLRGGRVVVRPVAGPASTAEREVASVVDEPSPSGRRWNYVRWSPSGDRIAVAEAGGRLAVFPVGPGPPGEPRVLRMVNPEVQFPPVFDPSGTRLLWGSAADRRVSIWDLEGPPDAEPLELLRPDAAETKPSFFDYGGDWVVVVNHSSLAFWSQRQPRVRVLPGHAAGVRRLVFTRDGKWLLSCADDAVRTWPLAAAAGRGRHVDTSGTWCYDLAVAPDAGEVLSGGPSGAYLAPLSGAAGHWLYRNPEEDQVAACAIDDSGRFAATAPGYTGPVASKALRIWDLARGGVQVLPLVPPGESGAGFDWGVRHLSFTPEGHVLAAGRRGIRRFDPRSGESIWIWNGPKSSDAGMSVSADGRLVLAFARPSDPKDGQDRPVVLLDLAGGASRSVTSHGNLVDVVALDASGRVLVTGDTAGAIRVGLADGEPHLLLGHAGAVSALAVSPDGKWIASASGGEIRLWPMPDVTKPPLHTLPYAELMTKLQALTNLQVVEDAGAATGYRLEVGPFPGWRDVPTW